MITSDNNAREFDKEALCAEPVFYRTYSRRKEDDSRETFKEVCQRAVGGLKEIGNLSDKTERFLLEKFTSINSLPAGRWLWIGGTKWSRKPENHYSAFNCSSLPLNKLKNFSLLAYLAMQGCGTGAVIEEREINQLPTVRNRIKYTCYKLPGERAKENRLESTVVSIRDRHCIIYVGDSKEGWRDAYQALIDVAFLYSPFNRVIELEMDFSSVRPKGEELKGFGGVANPNSLSEQFRKIASILSQAQGRNLNAKECCLLIDEMASAIVSGNIRRSAGMRQFDKDSELLKMNLWQPDQQGNWRIDPKRDALRMANHTRNYYFTPSLKEMTEAVRSQFYSGEGAIFWAPESLARTNSDLFPSRASKNQFINTFLKDNDEGLELVETKFYEVYGEVITPRELNHRMSRTATNPCLEGNTLVLTDQGNIPIKDLVGKEVNVWTGEDWESVDNFRVTGKNQDVYKVSLFDGRNILATSAHTFILKSGLRIGLLNLQEGDVLKSHNWYYDESYKEPLKSQKEFFKNAKVKSVTYYSQEEFVYCCTVESNHSFALSNGIMVGNCGEILGSEFLCCLSEIPLTELDPWDYKSQKEAFQAGGLSTASLLHLKFEDEDMQYSREIDPIIGVGFTGLFDFFVTYFGVEWLEWWSEGRPKIWSSENWPSDAKEPQSQYFQRGEKEYLNFWRSTVYETVKDYCENNGLRVPNRYTCVKPSGTMSNLSKSSPSPGWHPPKALYYIRRITFRKEDPVALACIDYGYNVIPSQSDKDESGNLLHDPYDPRCTEWLVEIPMKTAWADMKGADKIDPSKFSALAQFDFALTVQQEYVTHNTSSTIELREAEIDELAEGIHKAIVKNKGYVSAALLGRFDDHQSYPRLPFEPIDRATYYELLDQVESNRSVDSFHEALKQYDIGEMEESGPSGCDSDKCIMPD